MNREYLTYSLEEFYLLGRKDALTDGIKDTNTIIKNLIPVYGKKETLKMLTKYIQGYKIGILENKFKVFEMSTRFDMSTKSFTYYDENGDKMKLSFEKGYNSLEEESYIESSKLIKNLRS